MTGYTSSPVAATSSTPGTTGGDAQQFVEGRDISGDWWTLFQSAALNDLIERALKANPDLKAAQAALVVARENVLAQRGAYYPFVSGSFSAARAKTAAEISPVPNSGDLTYSLYTPSVSVSYVPDVFGLNRRTVESLAAQAQGARFALAAAHITLTSNVVAAAVQEASLRAQLAATRELVAINSNMLQLLRTQFAAGYVGRLDVAAQESAVAQITATLPPLLKQLAQQRDLLAVLAGGFPSQQMSEQFELSSMQLPQELPLSVPSTLVEQRPDILQAEANLHAASAQIGVAVANRLPSFSLTGNLGSMALAFTDIFMTGTGFWTLGASVAQPIYEGGTLLHRERAARGAFEQASELYRAAVLTAFQNIADTLNALEQDADGLKAATAASVAARTTLDLATNQFQLGYVNYLSLLSAQQTYQQALIALAQARANRYADTAALFQALGGGWWHRGEIPSR